MFMRDREILDSFRLSHPFYKIITTNTSFRVLTMPEAAVEEEGIMETSADGRRVCRLPVTLHCPTSGSFFSGFTRDLGLDGMFVEGASCLSTGIEVNISVVDSQQVLSVTGHIETAKSKGTEIRFSGLSNKERSTLERMLWPGWDGGDSLLDCFLVVARREPIYNLTDCVRLTTLVEGHRHAVALTSLRHRT